MCILCKTFDVNFYMLSMAYSAISVNLAFLEDSLNSAFEVLKHRDDEVKLNSSFYQHHVRVDAPGDAHHMTN